jgi:hypothetical protein
VPAPGAVTPVPADLEKTLHNYLKLYNHHIPQRAIDSKTPIQALKERQRQKPDLFVKRVYEQTGLDRSTTMIEIAAWRIGLLF